MKHKREAENRVPPAGGRMADPPDRGDHRRSRLHRDTGAESAEQGEQPSAGPSAAETEDPREPDESLSADGDIQVETPFCTLYFPGKWRDQISTRGVDLGYGYEVFFFVPCGDDTTELFAVLFGFRSTYSTRGGRHRQQRHSDKRESGDADSVGSLLMDGGAAEKRLRNAGGCAVSAGQTGGGAAVHHGKRGRR